MGLPTSNTNTPGMLMQARKVNSACVCMFHAYVLSRCVCVCVCVYRCTFDPFSQLTTHTNTYTHQLQLFNKAISITESKPRNLTNPRELDVKPWQPDLQIPNISSRCRDRFILSSAPLSLHPPRCRLRRSHAAVTTFQTTPSDEQRLGEEEEVKRHALHHVQTMVCIQMYQTSENHAEICCLTALCSCKTVVSIIDTCLPSDLI